MALLGDGVLVCEHVIPTVAVGVLLETIGAGGRRFAVFVDLAERFRIRGVDCWDDGKVVLIFVEVFVCGCDGLVKRVGQGRVEWSEGKFVDVMREVEGCDLSVQHPPL